MTWQHNVLGYEHCDDKQRREVFGLSSLGELTRTNFRNVIMLTHVCKILIEILNPVSVRFVSCLGQSVIINSLPLFYVPFFNRCEMLIITSGLSFLAQFVAAIIDFILIRVSCQFCTSTYIKYLTKFWCMPNL